MEVAPKVIFLSRDKRGHGNALANSLQPSPQSQLQRTESSFELSLESYGISGTNASGDLISFIDAHGSPVVSMLLLQNYEPPVAACAVSEVLRCIMKGTSGYMPSIIVPIVVADSRIGSVDKIPSAANRKVTLYAAEFGPSTDVTQIMVRGMQYPPLSFRLQNEPLACLLQIVPVLKFPVVLLVAATSMISKSVDHEVEALYELGEFLASPGGLCLCKDKISGSLTREKAKVGVEAWRAIYG
ncbi:uncharacterized protein LOC116250860 [Nymphaea colorata]|nr:uncharacterized protein LOC116250860 [Nymphaea colorata]